MSLNVLQPNGADGLNPETHIDIQTFSKQVNKMYFEESCMFCALDPFFLPNYKTF